MRTHIPEFQAARLVYSPYTQRYRPAFAHPCSMCSEMHVQRMIQQWDPELSQSGLTYLSKTQPLLMDVNQTVSALHYRCEWSHRDLRLIHISLWCLACYSRLTEMFVENRFVVPGAVTKQVAACAKILLSLIKNTDGRPISVVSVSAMAIV